MNYLAFYKPYEVLSQFTDPHERRTLKEFIRVAGVYPAGRLDYRSEGLLILSDDGLFIQRLSDPRYDHPKTYLVQVEGIPTESDIGRLNTEILIPSIQTKPVQARIIPPPDLIPRSKPVRDYHPTAWLQIILTEGKKHQVRRLTAAIGLPTLRLVRVAIGSIQLGTLQPGEWRVLSSVELRKTMKALEISKARSKI